MILHRARDLAWIRNSILTEDTYPDEPMVPNSFTSLSDINHEFQHYFQNKKCKTFWSTICSSKPQEASHPWMAIRRFSSSFQRNKLMDSTCLLRYTASIQILRRGVKTGCVTTKKNIFHWLSSPIDGEHPVAKKVYMYIQVKEKEEEKMITPQRAPFSQTTTPKRKG